MVKLVLIALLVFAAWRFFNTRPKRITMDAIEARAVLGVPADADEPTIRAAHRRLLLAVHPDKGGSADLTRRINVARDTLLRRT